MQQLDDRERLDWLQLIRTGGVGPTTFAALMARFESAEAALSALPEIARNRRAKNPFVVADRDQLRRELDHADMIGARLIASCEPDYPALLRETPGAPPLLYVCGDPQRFAKPSVAIIGARNASGAGRKMAGNLAADLGAAGFVVVSGLARGIDGAAHAASIDTGTIAVVAGGVDIVYPPEHGDLFDAIRSKGALVSERPPGTKPTARDFPRRNRIISGLSRGVVVVEAAARSGTMITVNFALEQGRDVFAVPGSPLDPRCAGANRMIRDGAILIENANDILEALDAQLREPAPVNLQPSLERASIDFFDSNKDSHDQLRQQLVDILGPTPLHRDEILRYANAPAGLVADLLLHMVLTGEAQEHEGGKFSKGG